MIKLYGIKTERGTVYTTAAYEGSLPVVSEEGWFVSEDDLMKLAKEARCSAHDWNQGEDARTFHEWWTAKKKEIL